MRCIRGLLQYIRQRRKELMRDLKDEYKTLRKAEDEFEEDVAVTCIACMEARLSELREIEKVIKKYLNPQTARSQGWD